MFAAQRTRLMPISEVLADVVDDSFPFTLTRIEGISGLHYASSWPSREPTHALEPSADGTFTLTQLFTHRQWFSCIRRPVEYEWRFGIDRPGRHAPIAERGRYVMAKALRSINEITNMAGLF